MNARRTVLLALVLLFPAGAWAQNPSGQEPKPQQPGQRYRDALATYKMADPAGYAELMKLRGSDREAFRKKVGELLRGPGVGAAIKTPDTVKVVRDIVYATYGKREVKLDLYLPAKSPAGKLPCIMVIHGGGWRSGNKQRFARFASRFAEKGFAAACIGYRLRPEVEVGQCVEDVKASVRWVRANAAAHNIDPERIGAYGGSAGAHLAAMLGTSFKDKGLEGKGGNAKFSSRVVAVVAMATPADLTGFARHVGVAEAKVKRISPVTHVDSDSARFLLIHARGDGIVRYRQSELLVQKLKAAKVAVKLAPVEGRSHAFWNGRGGVAVKALADAVAFFEETLMPKSAKAP